MGHSYGVKNTYYQLLQMKQEKKDKMIKNFVSLGGNFFGSLESDISLLMALDYYKLFKIFKLHYAGTLKSISHLISVYEAALRSHIPLKNEKWY